MTTHTTLRDFIETNRDKIPAYITNYTIYEAAKSKKFHTVRACSKHSWVFARPEHVWDWINKTIRQMEAAQ